MKKLFLVLAILILAVPAHARGPLSNIFASWYNVTTATTTITLPFQSRDVLIWNGSATALVISLMGESIPTDDAAESPAAADIGHVSASSTRPTIIQIDDDKEIYLTDFRTSSITMRTITGTASPVSVIVTY